MQAKHHIRSALLIVCLALGLGVYAGVASASTTTITFTATTHGPYACLGPCSTATQFTANGIAQTDSKSLGTLTYSGTGTVLDYNPVTNCLDQAENFAFTTQNGHDGKDTFYLTMTTDTFCFTDDPNVSIETATFQITGGTGRFVGAAGSGTWTLTVLTHPQKGSGTLTATITY
jgi:hypothetical protein